MKLLALLFLIVTQALAGTLTDPQGVFQGSEATISQAIASEPVWIQTVTGMNKDGLNQYADAQVRTLTPRGFLVVIHTNPKAWRISMNPPGMANSEMVRRAGDAMAQQFKAGNFQEGAIGVARELTRLSQPSAAKTTTVTTTTTRHYIRHTDWTPLWVLLGIILFAFLVIWLLSAYSEGVERRDQYRRERDDAAPSPRKAQAAYDRFTPAQRQAYATQYCNHPNYSPGILNDPVMFYLFMRAVEGPAFYGHGGYEYGYGGVYGTGGGYGGETDIRTESVTTRSDESQPVSGDSSFSASSGSSSDSGGASSSFSFDSSSDSGSSGGFDSGSSDSGSSSGDSGGSSGGDW